MNSFHAEIVGLFTLYSNAHLRICLSRRDSLFSDGLIRFLFFFFFFFFLSLLRYSKGKTNQHSCPKFEAISGTLIYIPQKSMSLLPADRSLTVFEPGFDPSSRFRGLASMHNI